MAKRSKRITNDMPTKDKRRATRRKRNFIAKEMLSKKKGGPMDDKKRKLLEEQEKEMIRQELMKRHQENWTDAQWDLYEQQQELNLDDK